MDIDFFDLKLEPGDVVLMCSDGLSNMVEDSQLREIISDTSTDLDEKRQDTYKRSKSQWRQG